MNNSSVLEVIIRTFASLIALFIFTKIMGKKQISQLNVFDYIVGITIGSLAADISLDVNKPLLDGVISMAIFSLSATFVSLITIKSICFRRIFTGTPTNLMEKGKIIEKGLQKAKLDVNDLLEEARNAGYFNLEEIEYAIMETNGRVSFLPNDKDKPITKKDMKLKLENTFLVANIIIDTHIIEDNLKSMHKNKKWVDSQLKVLGYDDYRNILLATLDSNDKIIVYEKNINSKYNTILE